MDKYAVGDIVTLKKQHPCGSKDWEILRVGADFRLQCMGCGHMVMISRKLVEKNDRGLKKAEEKHLGMEQYQEIEEHQEIKKHQEIEKTLANF